MLGMPGAPTAPSMATKETIIWLAKPRSIPARQPIGIYALCEGRRMRP